MRKSCALVSLLVFSWIGGLGQDASAGVTIDVVFQDATIPSGLTISQGAPGTGCAFGGYAGGSVATGFCMDVMLYTTYDMVALSTSVAYDTDDGLAVSAIYEWKGAVISWNRGAPDVKCIPNVGMTDSGTSLTAFDCLLTPNNPPVMSAGTYRVGTVVWDTSGILPGVETVAAYINDLDDGVAAIINGNVVRLTSADIVVGSHLIGGMGEPAICGDGDFDGGEECDDGDTTPGDGCDGSCQIESGWTCEGEPSVCTEVAAVPSMGATGVAVLGVAVLGIGVVGLVITARRRFN